MLTGFLEGAATGGMRNSFPGKDKKRSFPGLEKDLL